MMRIVKAALLTCVVAALPTMMFAQGAPGQGAGAGAGAGTPASQCQMADPEYQVYNNANTQTDPKAKAAALEAYLTQFPNSCAKQNALTAEMAAYYAAQDFADAAKTADRILQIDPTNPEINARAAVLHYSAASAMNDADPKKLAAERQPELDQAATDAQKALSLPKPANVTDDAFTTFKENFYPPLYTAIGYDAYNKDDFAGAIDGYKKELAFYQADPKLAPQLQQPGQVQFDTFFLSNSYFKSQPPDFLNCAFFATRAAAFLADAAKPQAAAVSKYCYHKYHGQNDDQYDKLTQIAKANVFPPADLATTITPAPTAAQMIADVLKTTPIDQLATADKENILQNGSPDQVQQVWDSMKGKSFQFPDLLVISSTPQQVQVAVSEDAKANKTADFTFNLAAPEELPAKATVAQKRAYDKKQAAIAAAIAPGQTVTLSGTFDSYTPKPFMITMSDGQVVLPEAAKPAPKAAPARRPAARRATH